MFSSTKKEQNIRVLTGDRPTGRLHLGHYFGSLKKRIELQNTGYECFLLIADYQVLTDRLSTKEIEKNIIDITTDYLSVGIDSAKTTIFLQSRIPALAELSLLLSMLASFSKIQGNPTVKEEIKSTGLNKKASLGMISYPVSQAADILLFKANYVPVGEDQLPHIELTREIARIFNKTFKTIFPLPEPILSDAPRLLGLD
ncbi:MAG: tryptophan--tRNA ligase, partial [Candidatus Paceibacteria bacterium]